MADYVTPRLGRWRYYTDVPLLIVALGSLPLLLLELERHQLTPRAQLGNADPTRGPTVSRR